MSGMFVTLEKTKEWLRVVNNDEDPLISDFIVAAEDIVAGVLRFPLANYEGNLPEPVKHAIYFTVSKMYEERNELKMPELVEVLKQLLFTERQVSW